MTNKIYPPTDKFMQDIMKACRSGDIDFINDAISNNKISANEKGYPNQMLLFACVNGHLNICKAIFDAPSLSVKVNSQTTLKHCIDRAFSNSNIDVIEFLIEKLENINTKTSDVVYSGLVSAIRHGHLDVVKYFLGMDQLYDIYDEEVKLGDMISAAFTYDNLDIIKFLLEESALKDKYDIHMQEDNFFKIAYNNGQKETLRYLIWDKRIEKTASIEQHLNYSKLQNVEEINQWFKLAKLSQHLQDDLPLTNGNTKRKVKV